MLEHILRRMGFGASPAELASWADMPIDTVIDRLLNYESALDRSSTRRSASPTTSASRRRGQPFSPNTLINDARQRWLFRMIHSQRPLEEKMALFWHNHFATAYSKVAGAVGQERAHASMMDNDPASLAGSAPRPDPDASASSRTGSFRDAADRGGEGPGDGLSGSTAS